MVASNNAPGTAMQRIQEALAQNELLRLAKQRKAAESAGGLRILSANPLLRQKEKRRMEAAQARELALGEEIRNLTITDPAQRDTELAQTQAEAGGKLQEALIGAQATRDAAGITAQGNVERENRESVSTTLNAIAKLSEFGLIDPKDPVYQALIQSFLRRQQGLTGAEGLSALDQALLGTDVSR
jgi:hypothetical protein